MARPLDRPAHVMRAARRDSADVSQLQRAWYIGVALLALAVAAACLPWPEQAAALLPIAPRPLHARCIGAMYLAAAVCLLVGTREPDAAALRIPLSLVAGGAAAMALAASTVSPLPWPFLLLHAAVACSAAAWAWRGRELLAPAERPDAGLLAMAAVMAGVAAALAFVPQQAAPLWPWPMPPLLAPFYAAPLFAWGLATVQVARERRRGARRIVLVGLCTLGATLLFVSALHLQVFRGAALWPWFGAVGAGLALAAQRLFRGVRPALR